jgi:hypothetical protein
VSRNLYEQAFTLELNSPLLVVLTMRELAITNKRLSAVFLMILLLVAAIFSSFLYVSLNQISDVKTQNDRFQSQNAELPAQNDVLQNQESELQKRVDEFQLNESEAQKQLSSLKQQNYDLNETLASLNGQILSLKSQLTSLTSANLTASLNVIDVDYYEFNDFYITGSVGNTGLGTAYNAGLHVLAYIADGTLEINMTVPLKIGVDYGTDEATSAVAATLPYPPASLELGSLGSYITAPISLAIFHHGTVTNWTITPVWTSLVP